MRGRPAVLVVVGAAFVAPAQAHAGDHVWLSLDRARLADGWSLTGASAGGDFYPGGRELVGLTLSKRHSASAVERHAFRADLARATVSFDGRQGRWTAQRAGGAFDVSMKMVSTGAPQPVSGQVLGCRGSFLRRAVRLEGTFVLRTGTAAFGTIRKTRLTASVTYNAGGAVDCGVTAGSCESGTSLSAYAGPRSLVADPARRTLVLSFRGSDGWYHVIELSRLSVPAAEPPTIRIGVPPNLPVGGTLTFTARDIKELIDGPCRVTTAQGDLTGKLRVRFTGWGARTFAASTATYRQTSPA
jgi:hypothetical protein